jgi:hypothetical protein
MVFDCFSNVGKKVLRTTFGWPYNQLAIVLAYIHTKKVKTIIDMSDSGLFL